LDGVVVLDFTMVWAGPYATKLLADMGATVIKIESPNRMDPIRMATIEIFMQEPLDMATRPYNRSAYFNEYNRNKRSLVVDTLEPRGRAIVEKLISVSDILIENFRPGVLERLGYGDELVFGINPKLTRVSMPAYGTHGSEARMVGYGPNIEEMSGLARLNGYADGSPLKTGISFADPMAGVMAAAGSMLGLIRNAREARGSRVEVSQRDAMIAFLGEAVMEWAMNERDPVRSGNRSERYAPQGCYRCKPLSDESARRLDVYHSAGQGTSAQDRWVTLSVRTDDEWMKLCQVMNRMDLATDPRFASTRQRAAQHDELDEIISEWTREMSDETAMLLLQEQGIPAGRVLSCLDVASDPHLKARGFLEDVVHPEAGATRVTTPAWRLQKGRARVRRPAPCFGQDNRYVLQELLGMSETDVSGLVESGVIATTPRL
jgi:crotonobetainyl-CoA:carnitine CoA-transferase CaiB-like acyl-CoA transferase